MQKLQLIMPPAAKIHFLSDFYDAKPKFRIFLCCRHSPGTSLEKRAVKNGVVSAQGGLCTTSERRVMKVLLEQ